MKIKDLEKVKKLSTKRDHLLKVLGYLNNGGYLRIGLWHGPGSHDYHTLPNDAVHMNLIEDSVAQSLNLIDKSLIELDVKI